MQSRLSKIMKTEDPTIRYKDCDISGKASSAQKTPAKARKVRPLTTLIFKTPWGEISLN